MELIKNIDVKKYRHQIGITQKQLSGLTGIDTANISKLENGKIELYDGWKERIELAFQLFKEEQNEN
jgi:predicted transcriptional regulator